MGQQLFKIHSEISDPINILNSDEILSFSGTDDIRFFFPLKTSSDGITSSIRSDRNQPIPNSELNFIKQIQNHLTQLTKSSERDEINNQINEILKENVFSSIETSYKNAIKQITDQLENEQQLKTSFTKKFKEENSAELSIFAQSFVDSSDDDQSSQNETSRAEQLSYFAVQSLTSILLILIKSAEKSDSTIVQQILMLTSQLCEQIPLKSLSNSNYLLFKSLKPLTNYIQELSLSNDSIRAQQSLLILLSFSVAKGSFKDILLLLNKFMFDPVNVYNVRGLFIQLNNGLTAAIKQQNHNKDDQTETTGEISSIALDYLKSIGVYPNIQLMKLDDKIFTGQLISSVILAHIDFDNQLHSDEQLKRGSVESSFSVEFHPNTFQLLFDIIEQLATIEIERSSAATVFILTVALRLFTTHLKYFCATKTNLHRDLLSKNDKIQNLVSTLSSESNNYVHLSEFITDDQLTKWFQLLLRLACEENQMSERKTISEEASKAIVYLIDKRTSSFIQKLSIIHQYIVENRYPTLIKQFFAELNKNETLLSWIEILCDNNDNKSAALQILYSFIEICFNTPIEMDKEQNEQIQKILLLFQQHLIYRLVPTARDNTELESSSASISASSLVIDYLTHLFKNYTRTSGNDLFIRIQSILSKRFSHFMINSRFDLQKHSQIQWLCSI